MTAKLKRGLIAFVAFDVLLVLVLISLFIAKSEVDSNREAAEQLRNLGTTVFPTAIELDDFQLQDQFGNPFSKQDFSGDWTLVFFGFTNCPDICPLTMSELKQFYERLDEPSLKQDLKIVMVTVDPERDDPQSMGSYVGSYHPDFIGLSGSPESISNLASQLYVAHSRSPQPEAVTTEASQETAQHEHAGSASTAPTDDYLIQHSGHIAVINPQAQYHAVIRLPHRDQDLAKVYRSIRSNWR